MLNEFPCYSVIGKTNAAISSVNSIGFRRTRWFVRSTHKNMNSSISFLFSKSAQNATAIAERVRCRNAYKHKHTHTL